MKNRFTIGQFNQGVSQSLGWSIDRSINQSINQSVSQVKSSQVKSSQVKSGLVKSSQVKSSQVKSSQVKSSQVSQSVSQAGRPPLSQSKNSSYFINQSSQKHDYHVNYFMCIQFGCVLVVFSCNTLFPWGYDQCEMSPEVVSSCKYDSACQCRGQLPSGTFSNVEGTFADNYGSSCWAIFQNTFFPVIKWTFLVIQIRNAVVLYVVFQFGGNTWYLKWLDLCSFAYQGCQDWDSTGCKATWYHNSNGGWNTSSEHVAW